MAMSRRVFGTLLCGLLATQLYAAQTFRANADAAGYTLDWQPGPANLVSQHDSHGDWLQVSFDDAGYFGAPGAPDLPLLSRMIELPDESGVSVELLEAEWETVSGVVAPNQERMLEPDDFPAPYLLDEDIYSSDTWYPGSVLSVSKPMLARNLRLAKVDLVPVRTNPVSGETQVLRSAQVRVNFSGTDLRNARSYELPAKDQLYRRVMADKLVQLPEHEADRGIFDVPEAPGRYLIFARTTTVSNDAYFVNWVNWKREKGHDVEVITESDLGAWTSDAIKGEIENQYFSDTPPLYVTLVGDPNASADYYLPYSSSQYDHIYGMIDGDDLIADVAVGRLSVENANQLRTVMYKFMMYETTPTAHSSGWLGKAAMMTGYAGLSMIQQSRSLCNDMIANGITEIDTVWHPNGSAAWVENCFNEGICLYNYRGYINMNGLNESYFNDTSVFQNSARTPVAAIFTCDTGTFGQSDGPCETELFLRWGDIDNPRGAVAALGFATSGTATRYNNVVVAGFWGAFLDHGLAQIGPALAFGKYELVTNLPVGATESASFSYWGNLMGDPGMDMWCGVPAALSVSHNFSGNIPLGATGIDAYVSSIGTAVSGAAVCAYQGGVIQSVGITDASGHVILDLSGIQAGALQLTATKVDYLPSRNTLTVSQFTRYPSVVDAGINGDGIANPAESVVLNPVVANTGSSSISFLTATVSLDAEYGTISDATLSWPAIASGSQAAATGSCSLTLASDLPDGTMVPASIVFNTGSENYTDLLWIEVSAPRPVISDITFNEIASFALPGQTATMELQLANLGSYAASGLQFTLGDGGFSFITMIDGSFSGYNAAPGESAEAVFELTIDNTATRGLPVSLPLTWSSPSGITGSMSVDFVVGYGVESGPTGPDAYGYIAIESTDSYTLAPTYSWVEVASPAGGSGTALGLTDYGGNQDDAATVAIPIHFVYYGKTYSELAVCSNGFLGMEEGAVDQTDFRNHFLPSATGPDGMIAVMWDDLMQTGNADVYTYYDVANHRFIIEWYDFVLNAGGDNTFQIILFDVDYYSTPTGDSPILTQYQVWNNDQSNIYDFPYCSVGIEDESASMGLTLTNYNVDAATISGFTSGKAVYYTTARGESLSSESDPPVIETEPVTGARFDEPVTIEAEVYDASCVAWVKLFWRADGSAYNECEMAYQGGDTWKYEIAELAAGTVVDYYLQAQDLATVPNQASTEVRQYTVLAGDPPTGPDTYGYYIFDSEDAGEGHEFDWVSVPAGALSLTLADDATSTISLPFDVIFYGQSYSTVSVCSNGFLAMGSSSTTTYSNGTLPAGSVGEMIAPFWDDLNPSSAGSIDYWYDSDSHRFFVCYTDVPHFGSTIITETFQLAFCDEAYYATITGDTPILIQYHTVSDATSCTVGIANDTADGIQYLYGTGSSPEYAADAATIVSGQVLWITTGEMVLAPVEVTDLMIQHTNGQFVLSWTSTGAGLYRVYRADSPYGNYSTLIGTTTDSNYSLGAVAGRAFYQVCAVNGESLLAVPRDWRQVTATYSTDKTEE